MLCDEIRTEKPKAGWLSFRATVWTSPGHPQAPISFGPSVTRCPVERRSSIHGADPMRELL